MKTGLLLTMLLAASSSGLAADATTIPTWHAQTLGQALGNMLIFALAGIMAAIIGFKLFDTFTPGSLTKEILENKNIAAAIVAGAVILGVCMIVAAAIFG